MSPQSDALYHHQHYEMAGESLCFYPAQHGMLCCEQGRDCEVDSQTATTSTEREHQADKQVWPALRTPGEFRRPLRLVYERATFDLGFDLIL